MRKILNLNQATIENVKNNNCRIINKTISSSVLDLNLKLMAEELVQTLKCNYSSNDRLFYSIEIIGECNKDDVEDLYDYIENALTDIYCDSNTIADKEKERLGIYGWPKTNLKKLNYLRWIKCNNKIAGIGFEIKKAKSMWNKRMIK